MRFADAGALARSVVEATDDGAEFADAGDASRQSSASEAEAARTRPTTNATAKRGVNRALEVVAWLTRELCVE